MEVIDRVTALNRRGLATVVLAVLPLLSALVVVAAAYLVGGTQGGDAAHLGALSLGWLVGAIAAIRFLRRRWSDQVDPSSARLFLASAASLVATVGLAVATAPWQDLMSQPRPTPLMFLKDLTSTLAPLVAGLLAPWYVLGGKQTQEAAMVKHGTPAA
jgi:hypothetical protein